MTAADRPLADLIAESGLTDDTKLIALQYPSEITTAPVSWQSTKPLTGTGIATLGQLGKFSDADLLTIPFFGPSRLSRLKYAVLGAIAGSSTGEQE